jgi:hypothetical protein
MTGEGTHFDGNMVDEISLGFARTCFMMRWMSGHFSRTLLLETRFYLFLGYMSTEQIG